MKHLSFFLFLVSLTTLSCYDKNNELQLNESLNAAEFLDVSYGTNEYQKFDLYLPQDRTQISTKIIVLIHGGGWTSGDKSDLNYVYDYLKTNVNEYAIVNLNYTLADLNTSPIPLQINDIDLFLKYFKERINEYNLNPEFTFVGTSAGAHLSMLYGYQYNENQDVKAICNIVGPTDFLHTSYINTSEPETAELIANVQLLFGLPINENVIFYELISPYYSVNEFSPPTISFYGGQDFLVPEEQGIILKEVLDSYDVINEYVFYEDEGHGWGNPEILDTLQRIETFLTDNFN